jgi:hypothetical protein
MSLLNEAEEMVEEAAEELEPIPSGPPMSRFFSRNPIETKPEEKNSSKPQMSR